MLTGSRIAFIGSGSMAEAMIKGLIRKKLMTPEQIMASGPRLERGQTLEQRYGIHWTTDNKQAVVDRDIIVLSVKPQVIPRILPENKEFVGQDTLILSIAAGIPIRMISKGFGVGAVARAMPNTPAQIGEGITVWTADLLSESQRNQVDTLLGALGTSIYVEQENYLDMATALSGTGPAYILLFMEAMIDAGVHLGFSRRVAEQLVLQTMKGSVEYARQSPRHPATLRNEVTSPGGTSAEALYQMEKGGMRTVVSKAVWAAYRRSLELGKQFDVEED